jgi:hypothetical protein
MKAAVLLGTSLVCAGISASGFAILVFLLLTRSLAPATAYFEKELFFDYTKPAAVASANFCQSPAPVKVRDETCDVVAKCLPCRVGIKIDLSTDLSASPS